MKAKISTHFEATLGITAEGIAARFVQYFNQHVSEDNDWYEHDWAGESSTFDLNRCRIFTVMGMWEFAIFREGRFVHDPSEVDNTLMLHVYPNIPMQTLSEQLPKFLQELGVSEFELRTPRYERCVGDAINYLLINGVRGD